jgi:hypothetical protein
MQPCVSGSPAFLLAGDFTWDQWDRILLNLFNYVYPANMCHSTLKLDQSSSLYHNPKTDPFGKGTEIHLTPAESQICPVAAFHHQAPLHRIPLQPIPWPLFKIVPRLPNQNLLASKYSGYSLVQKGAAVFASREGIPHSDIILLGWWKSDAVDIYMNEVVKPDLKTKLLNQQSQLLRD